ncbi:MAG TPA: adenylate/guanylate cyclase domain-containing protein, partial [Herpetosiphonaceae bacterium]|nr:adenylate/guanylate cyclase domain-containing protein [Herpetosiphonaceae bacterium]
MRTPPSGTVTFLFTDIEGSTRLWQAQPDAMRAALARHDQLLGDAIGSNGGYVFKTVGDAFYATFPTAPQALEAAATAQRLLAAEPWPPGCAIRVRMALHSGIAEERGGDYF